jgi:predicted enzyme related to lactoylglutathione lyase
MEVGMKVQYLEIVASDVDGVCAAYEAAHGIKFDPPDPLLGGARTAPLPGRGSIGVRAPLRDTEAPIIRPYWLVDDIKAAVDAVARKGAFIAHPPLEIAGKGTFAIYILGGVEHGLWQL